uniref:Homoserine kinase n=1 Tax=Lygus hesperus TaxID=30085 RepID=A0A0A9W5G3_LYGHE
MVVSTCKAAFDAAQVPMPPLKFTVHNDIPYGCGCGSSSAAAVAGYVAGLALLGQRLPACDDDEALLRVIAKLEGHPDNAAPAIYGGTQLGYTNEAKHVYTHRVPTPANLFIVLFIPSKLMKASTHVTRTLIPDTVRLPDAIHNISRTAMLLLAFSTNNMSILRNCSDVLHEQQRANALYPHYIPCAKCAREAGAVYVFLSGAGPTVCAFVMGKHSEVQIQPAHEHKAEEVAHAMV